MLRRKIQRASFCTNLLGYVVLFSVVIAHLVHRYSAANVSGADDGDVTFWFEGPQEGDDQPQHHRPFVLFNSRVILGVAGTFLISGLCDVGGIAGAGLFVPLFCLVVGFGLKAATGLAQAAISGVSLASLLFSSLFRTHPWDHSRTLVDFDLALLLLPSLLLGVTVGVMLNDLLPNWFINALLVALLLYVCHRKLIGGLTAWDEEAQHEMNVLAAAAISSRPMPQLKPICIHISRGASSSSSSAATTPQRDKQQQQQQQAGDKDSVAAAAGAAAGGEEGCGSSSSSSGGNGLIREDAVEVVTSDPSTPPTPYVGGIRDNSKTGSSIFGPAAEVWQQHLQQQQRAWSISSGEMSPSPLQQQQQQQCGSDQQQWQQQQESKFQGSSSSSSGSSDLRAPLLSSPACWHSHTTVTNNSAFAHPAAAAAAAAFAPRLLPAPAADQPVAAAAAAQWRALSPSHSVVTYFYPAHFDFIGISSFPWIKFCSVCTLWLGFLGLSALNSLIPLCSWYYINYMLSFLGTTVLVTVLFMKMTLLDPCSWNRRSAGGDGSLEEGRGLGDAAAAAAGSSGSWLAAARAAAANCRRWTIIWINVLTGATFKVPEAAVADAVGDGGSSDGSPPRLSLFKQALLQQQQEQLEEAVAAAEEPFPCIGAAAAAHKVHYATVAAAAAAAVAGAAGIASGVCGVAGGALLTPVLLDFRVHPQVAAATSVLLVFMSSSGAVLSFIMQGRLVGSYAVLFWSVSVLGACVGVGLVGALVHKMRCRASVVILLLSGLVGVACVSSAVYGVRDFVRDYQSDEGLGFRALCSYT